MKRIINTTIFLLSLFVLIGVKAAYAAPLTYLDPGSGSFIIQLLIGTIIGGLVIIRTYWGKIRAFFTGSSRVIDHSEKKIVDPDQAVNS